MERKEHCIKVHKFPKRYRFDDTPYFSKEKEDESNKMDIDIAVNNKKKKKSTKVLLNKNQKSKMFTKDTSSAICNDKNNDSVETISSPAVKTKTTPLAFIPRQVQKSFSKVLTNNQNREKNVLESDTMMELADTLPN